MARRIAPASGPTILTVYDYATSDAPELFADAHKQLLTVLIAHKALGQYIINMIWAVIDLSDAPHRLLTSDRPYILPRGLKDPSCVLGVPISPTRLFLAANNMAGWKRLIASRVGTPLRTRTILW